MEAAARAIGSGIGFVPVGARLPTASRLRRPLVETGPERDRIPPFGRSSAAGGRAAIEAVTLAICLALDRRVDAIVTAPISKEAIRAAGKPVPRPHRDARRVHGAKRHAMMLIGGPLRVSLATIHVPLAQVPSLITARGVREVIELTWDAVRRFGLSRPKIAVCGLNPHAGEAGMMGDEERRVIAPAVRAMAKKGIPVSGPYPADTIFFRAARGEFAAVVAMYHDQGLGPLKTLAFDTGVNLTLGLPIIRTSVDHGTAFDIAGKGVASAESLLAAVELAATMARNRARG